MSKHTLSHAIIAELYAQGKFHCRACKQILPILQAKVSNTKKYGFDHICRTCNIKKYPRTGSALPYVFPDGWKPNESCEMCDATENLVVDHCHITGFVRGTLCRACNLALGLMRDNPTTLTRGVQYLEKSNKANSTLSLS